MSLKVLLPFQIFAEKTGVARIVAETREGSFGLLPQRLDCVAALVPGILTYEIESEGEVYLAVDEGYWSRPARTCSFPCVGRWAEPTSANACIGGAGVLDPGRAGPECARGHGEVGDGIPESLRELST